MFTTHCDTSCLNPFFKEQKAATYMPTHLSELLNLQAPIQMYLQGISKARKQLIHFTFLWIPDPNKEKKNYVFTF